MNNFNRPGLIIMGIFLILILAVGAINYLGINIPYLSFLENGIFNMLNPAVELSHNVFQSINNYFSRIFKTAKIINENEELKEELAETKMQNLELKKYKRQNSRLRDLLAFQELVEYDFLGAEVIGFGPSNWENKILINRGKNDGLKIDMPVITYNGTLIGQIDYVGNSSAQVKLINDSGFVVAGIVQREESRAVGLVKGTMKKDGINKMDNISWEADIKEDDLILTSGLSNIFPKGLPIGKVKKVESDNYGVSQKADIDLFLDINTIEEVLVITNF